MKKFELTFIIVILLVLGAFIVLYFNTKSKREIRVYVYALENKSYYSLQNNDILANKLTKYLLENYKPSKIEINFLLPNFKSIHRVQLKSSDFKDKQLWNKEIYNKIYNGFQKLPVISFSNDSINEVIIGYCKQIEENSKARNAVNVLVGTFPDCYNETSRDKLQKQLDIFLKERKLDVKNLSAFIVNPRDNLEKQIFNTFYNTFPNEFTFQEIQTNKQRDCIENFPNIFAIFLKKFEPSEKIEFLNFLRRTFGEKFNLYFIHDGPLNRHSFTYSNTPADSSKLFQTLDKLTNATWKSTQFVFKELYNITSNLPDTTPKITLIVGDLQYRKSNRKGFEDDFWRKFSQVQGLVLYPIFPTYSMRNWRDKNVFDTLKIKRKFNIVEQ